MEEAPKREGPTPPPRKNPNTDVFCSCPAPARLVIVPTSTMPGQRCWRCANPDVQCSFATWHGPWITERGNIQLNETLGTLRNQALADDRTDQQAAAPPPPPPVRGPITRGTFVAFSAPRPRAHNTSSSSNQNGG